MLHNLLVTCWWPENRWLDHWWWLVPRHWGTWRYSGVSTCLSMDSPQNHTLNDPEVRTIHFKWVYRLNKNTKKAAPQITTNQHGYGSVVGSCIFCILPWSEKVKTFEQLPDSGRGGCEWGYPSHRARRFFQLWRWQLPKSWQLGTCRVQVQYMYIILYIYMISCNSCTSWNWLKLKCVTTASSFCFKRGWWNPVWWFGKVRKHADETMIQRTHPDHTLSLMVGYIDISFRRMVATFFGIKIIRPT